MNGLDLMCIYVRVRVMVFNVTRVPEQNHRPITSHWQSWWLQRVSKSWADQICQSCGSLFVFKFLMAFSSFFPDISVLWWKLLKKLIRFLWNWVRKNVDINDMTDYPTLHFDTNSSNGTALLLLLCFNVTVGSSTMNQTHTLKLV